MRANGGLPSMAKQGQVTVGTDLVVAPGGVVTRDEVAELIRYSSTTEEVSQPPTLVVPHPFGRYYFLDLTPGAASSSTPWAAGSRRSCSAGAVTPSGHCGTWTPTLIGSSSPSSGSARRPAATDVNVIGFCAGGILTTAALNKLAAQGSGPVNAAAFTVTLLDFGGRNPLNTFGYAPVLSLASWNSRRRGIMTPRPWEAP